MQILLNEYLPLKQTDFHSSLILVFFNQNKIKFFKFKITYKPLKTR